MRGGGEPPFKHQPSASKRALRNHLGFSFLRTPPQSYKLGYTAARDMASILLFMMRRTVMLLLNLIFYLPIMSLGITKQ